MSNKIYRLFEYAYILMAALSLYVVIINWEEDRYRSYLFAFFGIVAIFMFFFKRNFRKKMEDRNNEE
ncbi:MAG: hypothetical protein KUG68_11555 [Flavobacteriaceae bacterium]|nr:hypothetical protein [Flavobacteriaceae bacterium]